MERKKPAYLKMASVSEFVKKKTLGYVWGKNLWERAKLLSSLQRTIEAAVICILLYAVVYREAFEMAT